MSGIDKQLPSAFEREISRHDWSRFATRTSGQVPDLIRALALARTDEDADAAYWRLDGLVVFQRLIWPSALPTASCAVTGLADAAPPARLRLMELLVEIGCAESCTSEAQWTDLARSCQGEIVRGFVEYSTLLASGSRPEKLVAVDLLGMCADADSTLRARILYCLDVARAVDSSLDAQSINNWTEHLRAAPSP